MRPRTVGLIVAFTVLVPLLFLAKYNIHSLRHQQQQLGVREGIFSLNPRRKGNSNENVEIRSFTWFDNFKSFVGSDLESEEGFVEYQPVKQGHLNYQKRHANSINSFVSVTVSPTITLFKQDKQQNNTTDIIHTNQPLSGQSNQVQYNESMTPLTATNSEQSNTKLRQIDLLSSYRMNREAIGGRKTQEDENEDEAMRNVKCHNSKYDRLIAQKMSRGQISRPIVTADGRYDNPFPTWNRASLVDVLKFVVWESDESGVPKNKDELDKELGPMIKPNFTDLLRNNPNTKDNNGEFRATWIGHATLLIQVDGYNILTDPIFSERASFTQFFGPKRIRPPACDIKSLPPIDIVLISHNHYDHLDATSVRELNDRFGRDCRWVVPLGIGEFLSSMSVENYVELDWWQKDCYLVENPTNTQTNTQSMSPNLSDQSTSNSTVRTRSISSANPSDTHSNDTTTTSTYENPRTWNQRGLDIYLTPTQHWSRRGINDINRSLWGSFTIVNKDGSTFFFGGDTGYCSVFKEIGEVFGPFTGAAIPIGAYKPRWFLKPSHVDPSEAVQIHRDLRSMKSIGIHHSTFILSNEHYREPSEMLKEIMNKLKTNGSVNEPFITLKHGETTQFCKTSLVV